MIVVANPGTHPEMMRIAAGLIDASVDVRYLTSSSWASDSILQQVARFRMVSTSSLATDVRRRSLPDQIRSRHVVGLARIQEVGVQLAMRRDRDKLGESLAKRNKTFQAQATEFIDRTPHVSCVVGQYTAAQSIFEKLPAGVTKILNYPIAHHHWLMDAMQAEGDRNPKWRHLLQGHDFSQVQLRSLDREIALADRVLVPSTFAAETFLARGVPADKLRVIPLGCAAPGEVGEFQAVRRPEGQDALRVVYAGQVTQRKGIGYLVEAVANVEEIRLLIVGSASKEARAAITSYPNIEYRGSLPRNELYRTLQEADVLILPSLAEGFGLVALEAMINGTPCILSKNTFASDLITDNEDGFILNDVSSGSISTLLTKVAGNRRRLPQVGAAAELTARKYTWSRYETTVSQLILEVSNENVVS